MMITPLMRDYKKGKRVNIKGGGGVRLEKIER